MSMCRSCCCHGDAEVMALQLGLFRQAVLQVAIVYVSPVASDKSPVPQLAPFYTETQRTRQSSTRMQQLLRTAHVI